MTTWYDEEVKVLQVSAAQAEARTTTEVSRPEMMGKSDFLHLLVTQMRHQDPLDPIDNNEYIAQLTQFSQLEQLQNLNTSFETMTRWFQMNQASSLIERSVEAVTPEGVVSGVVEAVRVDGDRVRLVIGGKEVDVSSITRILKQEA